MPTPPGQLSVTAPAFVPKADSRTAKLVQHRPKGPSVVVAAAPAPALFGTSSIWSPHMAQQNTWGPQPLMPTTAHCAPVGRAQPPASYAAVLHRLPGRALLAETGLMRPTTGPDGRWHVDDADEMALVAEADVMVRAMGESDARALMLGSKALLGQAPHAAHALEAMQLMRRIVPPQRATFVALCRKMAQGSVPSDACLVIARDLVALSLPNATLAHDTVSRVYKVAKLQPLAAEAHLQLCLGLMRLETAHTEAIAHRLAGSTNANTAVWSTVMQRWLSSTSDTWCEGMHSAFEAQSTRAQAHTLMRAAAQRADVVLPADSAHVIATYLTAGHPIAEARRLVDVTCAILPLAPTRGMFSEAFEHVRHLSCDDCVTLVHLVNVLAPKDCSQADARLEAARKLGALPLATAEQSLDVLQSLCAKLKTAPQAEARLTWLVGLLTLGEQAGRLLTTGHVAELDAEDTEELMALFSTLPPQAWPAAMDSAVAAAGEFVKISLDDVPETDARRPRPAQLVG